MPAMPAKQDLITKTFPSRWKPGQSGNPNGRKKKADCLLSCIKVELDAIPAGSTLTNEQMIAASLISQARQGNLKAVELLMEYTAIKPRIEIAGAEGGPLSVVVRYEVSRKAETAQGGA